MWIQGSPIIIQAPQMNPIKTFVITGSDRLLWLWLKGVTVRIIRWNHVPVAQTQNAQHIRHAGAKGDGSQESQLADQADREM